MSEPTELDEVQKDIETRLYELSDVYKNSKQLAGAVAELDRQIKSAKNNLLEYECRKHQGDRELQIAFTRTEHIVQELYALYQKRKDLQKNPTGAKMGRKVDAEEK